MNMNMNSIKKFYRLLQFKNRNDSQKFISDIIETLNYYNDNNKYEIDNKDLIFNDNNLCVCNIIESKEPKWKSKCNFIINDYDKLNINYHRLIIYKIDDFIYYIEKNGNTEDLNNNIKQIINFCNGNYYNNFKIENKENINSTAKLYKKISNSLLYKNYFNNSYKIFCNKYRIARINYVNDDEFSYNNIINLSEDLINNKILDSSKKLSDSNLNNNEKQYYNDIEKYNFLDLDICDIYYDKENKLLFNYKTEDGYSYLCYPIIYSLILLKTKPKKNLCLNFINKFNIDINNFKYVIGVIKNDDYDEIDFKMSIGIICLFLNKLNIEYYIDFV